MRETNKKKVYLKCVSADEQAYCGALNVGIEHMGGCHGRVEAEDGTVIGEHYSSSIGWLRKDLLSKLDNQDEYEIIDELPAY